jgi:hypothetical protein
MNKQNKTLGHKRYCTINHDKSVKNNCILKAVNHMIKPLAYQQFHITNNSKIGNKALNVLIYPKLSHSIF